MLPATIECDLVSFFYFLTRVHELLSELTIIRKNEESFALGVEPANIEKPRELGRQQIKNRVPRFRIAFRRNKTRGFMEDDVEMSFGVDQFAADLNVIFFGRLRTEVGADSTIDGDLPRSDQLIAMPARSDAGGGEKGEQ